MNGTEALDGVKCVGSARVNALDFQGFALLFLSIFPLSFAPMQSSSTILFHYILLAYIYYVVFFRPPIWVN